MDHITQYKLKPYAVSFISYDKEPYYIIEFIKNVRDLKQDYQRTDLKGVHKEEPSPKYA